MTTVYPSENNKFALKVTVMCNGTKNFRVRAEDSRHKYSVYADRIIQVSGERFIILSFPVSPKSLFITVENVNDPNDKSFRVDLKEEKLKTYNIWLDEDTREFVQMAITVSQTCCFEVPKASGTLFQTPNGKYNIKSYPYIKDFASGRILNTPARIGHRTGLIEISAAKFAGYTIPMRMAILLHEFSHKYKNPNIGLKISNEIGADINALYIYLGLGFSKVDAICVFGNVFLKAQTDGNIERIRKIQDYIRRFENQEYAEIN